MLMETAKEHTLQSQSTSERNGIEQTCPAPLLVRLISEVACGDWQVSNCPAKRKVKKKGLANKHCTGRVAPAGSYFFIETAQKKAWPFGSYTSRGLAGRFQPIDLLEITPVGLAGQKRRARIVHLGRRRRRAPPRSCGSGRGGGQPWKRPRRSRRSRGAYGRPRCSPTPPTTRRTAPRCPP